MEGDDEEENKELDSEEDDVDDEAEEYLKKLAKKVNAVTCMWTRQICQYLWSVAAYWNFT